MALVDTGNVGREITEEILIQNFLPLIAHLMRLRARPVLAHTRPDRRVGRDGMSRGLTITPNAESSLAPRSPRRIPPPRSSLLGGKN